MGLDVQTLDHQVAEKQRMKQSEKETDKFERKHFPTFVTINSSESL